MISNQILQTTVDGLKEISRVDLCVIDAEGKVVAKTFDNVAECTADALVFIDSPADSQVVNGYQFFKVVEDGNLISGKGLGHMFDFALTLAARLLGDDIPVRDHADHIYYRW